MYWVLILSAVVVLPAERSRDSAGPDETMLQGRWEYVSVRVDGQPFPLEKGDYMMISGRNVSIHRNKMVIKAKYTLAPNTNPKHIDLLIERDETTFRLKEIYKLENDKLTLCEPPHPEAPRPTTFSAEKGERQFLIILKRSILKEK